MSFARLHEVVTYLIAALGFYALTLGGELGTTSSLLLALGLVSSLFARGPLLARPGWIRAWNVAVIVFLALQILRGFVGEPFLALGLEFAGFLQVTRLMNRRTAADHQQIAVLAFLHVIAATVLSTEIAYGLVFVGFVIVTPWMLVLSHLRREIEANYQAAGERKVDVARVLASKRIVGPSFLAGTAILTIPIFALTIVLFLVFPRVGMGFLAFGEGHGQRTAGFGSNVELGDFGVIRDDPTVVLRVRLPDMGARPPPTLALRMRGTSFDRYDGRRWTRGQTQSAPIRSHGDFFPIHRDERRGDRTIDVVLDHLDEPVIFIPPRAIGVRIPPRVEGGFDRNREVRRARGLDLRYGDDDALGLTYTVFVSGEPGEILEEPLDDEERLAYLALPEGMDRVRALAREIAGDAATDAERAHRIDAWLRDSGTFRYSLEMPDTGGRDPLEVFLFEARSGHCEYFSTAMAVMLRAIGIPTRNVTGFLGGAYNPYGNYYAIRQGDAHSWLEARIDDRWVTFDPTPPARGDIRPEEGVFAEIRAIVDALSTRWANEVVGYDLRSQVEGLRNLFRFARSVREAFSFGGDAEMPGAPDEASEPRRAPTSSSSVLAALVLLVAITTIAAVVLVLRRRRTRAATGSPSVLAAVRLYRELERALEDLQRPRPASTTPREHADALSKEGYAHADTVAEVTSRYEAARWGGEPLRPDEVEKLTRAIAAIRQGPKEPRQSL
jgi:transglutaminase-like putative cysteine protease